MSRFLLQADSESLDIEFHIIKELLYKNRFLYDSFQVRLVDLINKSNSLDVPIGDINFVTKFINHHYGIKKENPIEIPVYLRTDEFLKRDYKFVKAKDLPRLGNYFIKDVDTLKSFTYAGELLHLNIDEILKPAEKKFDTSLRIHPNTNILVSSIFNIQSEYRVYVISGKIEAICNYNGDVVVFPDVALINKAVQLINQNEKWLRSYTIDIMVGKEGTAIIEIHNFTSVGLYGTLWGDNLLYAYKQGIDYLINDNRKLEIE